MSSVCRVCLAGNLELNSLKNNQLIIFYEKLLETKFYSEDARPRALCCFCIQELLRCHKFYQMAHRSEKIFSQLVHQGLEATHEKIIELNLGKEQHLPVATMQLIMINQHQDEPILVKEEVTTKEEPLEDVESHEDCTNTLEDSDRETDVNELFPNIHFEQDQPDDFKKTFCCNYCSKVFFHESTLISHKRKAHSHFENMLKYSGDVCNKINNENNHLLNHMRTHTDEKPFLSDLACNISDVKLSYKCNLVKPIRFQTGENPFACTLCDKIFTKKTNLNRHMSTHTGEKPFGCNFCDKHFNRNHRLLEHMRTHTGEKPFACEVCDKKFSYKCDLVKHIRCHTGEKPYSCNVCDKRFNLKQSLDRHMRTHTGQNIKEIAF